MLKTMRMPALLAGLLLSALSHAACPTFAAGDTNYVSKLNQLSAGCVPTTGDAALPRAAAGGTVDAITATYSPALTLTDKTIAALVSAGANTSATPSFAPNALTAHTITARGGAALVAGDIGAAGFVAILEYNLANTRWELLNPAKVRGANDVVGVVPNANTTAASANTASAIVARDGSGNFSAGTITAALTGTASGNMVNPMTTGGDLIYGGSSGTPTRLANGTAGYLLQSNGTTLAPTWVVAPSGGGTLTATYVGFGDGLNLVTGSNTLTYSGGVLLANQSVNSATGVTSSNASAGTAAYPYFSLQNDNSEVALFKKLSTGYTTSGLLTASAAVLTNTGAGSLLIEQQVAAPLIFSVAGHAAANEAMRILGAAGSGSVAGNIGIGGAGGVTNPTARLHIKAGTATAGTAPLKIASGTNLTSAEEGAIEANGTNLFYTDSGPTRRTLVDTNSTQTITGKDIVATQLSGTVAAARMPALTGDVTTSAGAVATTLASVISASSCTNCSLTYDAKGRLIVASSGTSALSLPFNVRLTLESGVPISSSDQTAKTNIYITPYNGKYISLWDGAAWQTITFTEYTLALGTLTSGKLYDVFGYLSSGVLAAEVLVWTSDTARATAIALTEGVYTKSGDKTRLYLGTFYTTATTTTEDSAANRYVDSYFSPLPKKMALDNSTSHTYTSSTTRQWNNGTGSAQLNFIVGVARQAISVSNNVWADFPTNGAGGSGQAMDSTTVPDSQATSNSGGASTAQIATTVSVYLPAVGKHYVASTERAFSGTITFQTTALRGIILQ